MVSVVVVLDIRSEQARIQGFTLRLVIMAPPPHIC